MSEPRFLADTNLCIDLLVGRSRRASDRFAQSAQGEIITSAIVYAEVMIGALRLGSVEAAAALFRVVPALPFDLSCGDAYAILPFKRRSFDRLIAAHALALDVTLVTNNERDFADIPGLRVENWTL